MTEGTLSLPDTTERRRVALRSKVAIDQYFDNVPLAKVVYLDSYKKMKAARVTVDKYLKEHPV